MFRQEITSSKATAVMSRYSAGPDIVGQVAVHRAHPHGEILVVGRVLGGQTRRDRLHFQPMRSQW